MLILFISCDSGNRVLQHQNSWSNSGPNQSKSFKVLQRITDSIPNEPVVNYNEPAELQQPHYARPLGPENMNENQLRKLNLMEHDRAFMNRIQNDGKNPKIKLKNGLKFYFHA